MFSDSDNAIYRIIAMYACIILLAVMAACQPEATSMVAKQQQQQTKVMELTMRQMPSLR